jgi:hypothetical protein
VSSEPAITRKSGITRPGHLALLGPDIPSLVTCGMVDAADLANSMTDRVEMMNGFDMTWLTRLVYWFDIADMTNLVDKTDNVDIVNSMANKVEMIANMVDICDIDD